jgi:phosphomannomutase
LRADPPGELAGRPVRTVIDLVEGDPGRGLPPSDVVILKLEGARVVVRPSGTEPKLKCYLEVTQPVGDAEGLGIARSLAATALDELTSAIRAVMVS